MRRVLSLVLAAALVGGCAAAEAKRAKSGYADKFGGPVPDPVWRLLARARELGADAPVLLEWDAEIPPLAVVHADAERARHFLAAQDVAGAA